MGDLISRQVAIDAVKDLLGSMLETDTIGFYEIEHILFELPSAQPEPRLGRWEMLQIPINPPIYKCSECGSHALRVQTGCFVNRHYEAKLTNFCPNCGAKMLKDGEG